MFAKPYRFSFKNGVPRNVFQTPFFVIRYELTRNTNLECAVVVGKKVSKKAVERNRIKRKLVERIKKTVLPEKNLRLVIYAKKGINAESFDNAEKELVEGFEKIKII